MAREIRTPGRNAWLTCAAPSRAGHPAFAVGDDFHVEPQLHGRGVAQPLDRV